MGSLSQEQFLRVGVVGVGRMGHRHALNLLRHTPRAKLICVCTPAKHELAWAKEELEPHGVQVLDSFDAMIKIPGLQAIVIASSTSLHVPQSKAALDRGIHVLCEKPISESIQELTELCERIDAGTDTASLMVAYMRRFDQNHRDAYAKVKAGAIGEPIVYRSHTCEVGQDTPAYRTYLKNTGGIFPDAVIHDVDLAQLYFGDDIVPKSAYAAGSASVYKEELEPQGDADNAVGIVEFWNGKIAYFYESRTAAHGYDDACELWGLKGRIAINPLPRKNRVELSNANGVSFETDEDWANRYSEAYVEEVNVWVNSLLDGKALPIPLRSSLKSLQICEALQTSLRTGRKVEFTKDGQPLGL